MPSDVPRLGVVREIAARVGHACVTADRLLLHLDVATRPLADVKAAIGAYWSTFRADPSLTAGGLMVWEQLVLGRVVWPGDRVLLIGCGSGREVLAFSQRGCEVVGVEPSGETLAIARASSAQTGQSVTLLHGFAEDVDLPGTFDVCWFSYFAYSYIPDRRRRVALLKRLAAQLRPRGRIVVTCLSDAAPPRSRVVRIGQWVGRLARNDWQMAEGDVFVRAEPTIRLFHYQHVFSVDELAGELADGGLTLDARFPPEAFVAVPAA